MRSSAYSWGKERKTLGIIRSLLRLLRLLLLEALPPLTGAGLQESLLLPRDKQGAMLLELLELLLLPLTRLQAQQVSAVLLLLPL